MTRTSVLPAWTRRPAVRARASDTLYAAIGLLDTVPSVVQTIAPHGVAAGVLVGVTGLVGVAAVVLLRRSHPVLALLLALPGAFAWDSIDVPMTLALFALAIRRRDRVLALMSVVVLATFLAESVTRLGGSWGGVAIAGSIAVALATVGGAYIGARRDLVTSLRERAEEAEATAALLQQQARLSERTRIAREMHDVVAHRISLVALHAGALEVNPDAGPEQVEKAASLIGDTARQALEDLREVLGVLRSDGDDPDGLALAPQPRLEDVPRLVESSVAAGVPVTLEDRRRPDGPAVDEVVGRTVYRVVQEALTNVHKHARDAATRVLLDGGAPGRPLTVEVTNVRPAAAGMLVPGAGAGLVGLRERVALAGGSLDAGPLPGGGWRVRALFPGGPA